MSEYEAIFKTFLGIKKRDEKRFPAYIYDVIGRILGILLTVLIILLLISFVSFALKPFNVTITRVVELFWRDFTFVLSIAISLPSMIGTIRELFKSRDNVSIHVSIVYMVLLTAVNVLIALFGILPIVQLLGV